MTKDEIDLFWISVAAICSALLLIHKIWEILKNGK